ncbi:hypothetical protein [Citrobacter amalonaticus]|uniref:hypothetical protein n=1 Tax=Citrobacter amalonaticus TaxID=35703 RepID=UPI0020A5379B|nr:hypothetical protein [Citrobacter amalonaticus]
MSQIEGSTVLDIRDLVSATLKTETDIPSVVVPEVLKLNLLNHFNWPRRVFVRPQT